MEFLKNHQLLLIVCQILRIFMSRELQVLKVGQYAKKDVLVLKIGIFKILLQGSVLQIRNGMLTLKALENGSKSPEATFLHRM